MRGRNLDMLETVAEGMEDMLDQVVFIGGASACLLIDDPVAEHVRPTEDVDCLVSLDARTEFSQLEAELRRLGFRHATEPNAPICRWRYRGVQVDVMPDNAAVLGFSNAWYSEGIKHARTIELPSGRLIRCFTLPYFAASKLEAFASRGGDFRTSHDIEDIIIVLDGQRDLAALGRGPASVVSYLKGKFGEFLGDSRFSESVHGHLPPDSSGLGRGTRILDFLHHFTQS